jgi:hypothetical protein
MARNDNFYFYWTFLKLRTRQNRGLVTQNHEIQGNTVIRELLYFLVFRGFE